MASELSDIVGKATVLAADIADDDDPWNSPLLRSQAGSELAEQEDRHPPPGTGSWPWLQAPIIARAGLWAGVEEAKTLQVALDEDKTSYGADVLCRAILESLSLTWWLLEPEIDSSGRVARLFLFREHTAEETKRAVTSLKLGDEEDSSQYGELPGDVMAHAKKLSIILESKLVNGRKVRCCGDQRWLSHTDRVAQLVEHVWPQRRMPYAVLSAVAHAELLGLTRNAGLAAPGSPPSFRPAPDPTGLWLWQDTYMAVGALMFAAARTAGFLGLSDRVNAVQAAKEEMQRELANLRSGPPAQE